MHSPPVKPNPSRAPPNRRVCPQVLDRALPRPYANDSARDSKRHYSAEYDDALAARVGEVYGDDAKAFGYAFERPAPKAKGSVFASLLGGFAKKKPRRAAGESGGAAPGVGAPGPASGPGAEMTRAEPLRAEETDGKTPPPPADEAARRAGTKRPRSPSQTEYYHGKEQP